jgi:DNA modification methylase
MNDAIKQIGGESAEQLPLFAEATEKRNGSGFSDPAFAANKKLPIHRWVPWVAGFSCDFVKDVIDRHLPKKGLILDPFSGVGTTLVEGLIKGHRVAGFEINPYAALACKAKTEAFFVEPGELNLLIERFKTFYSSSIRQKATPKSKPPAGFSTRAEFYSPAVLTKVLLIKDFIAGIEQPPLCDLARLAFAATMVTYSNYSYEPSLGRRESAGREKIEDFAVGETVARKLSEMLEDVLWLKRHAANTKPSARIFNKSFFTRGRSLKANSVNLVITSPPYLNNYHYIRNTRPQLYWLEFVQKPQDFKELEQANFGKYWQTVREAEPINLDFKGADKEVTDCLELIRSKSPERGIYGGNGWANYAASYFNDCYRFSLGLKQVLKRNGKAFVVIGNSIIQGVMVPTDRFFGKIAEVTGLKVLDIHQSRATRVGSSIIQSTVRVEKAASNHRLYEFVVELQK